MLTDGVDAVDAAPGIWLSVSEIARQRGVSKQAIAKKVERLVADNLLTSRIGPQNAKLINVAAFDRLLGETTDAVRAANGRVARAMAGGGIGDPILAAEQAKKTAYQAELARLDLEERQGKLVAVAEVLAAVSACGDSIVHALDQMPGRADELAAAVGKDGAHGARLLLKEIAFDLRKAMERALRSLAIAAPPGDAAPTPQA